MIYYIFALIIILIILSPITATAIDWVISKIYNKPLKQIDMYLNDGREIYECDRFPGYYIDANTGDFCDEHGNYVGGNLDMGDKPGHGYKPDEPVIVFISKTGKQYYPKPNKSATIPIDLMTARKKGLVPSVSYNKFVAKTGRRRARKPKSKK